MGAAASCLAAAAWLTGPAAHAAGQGAENELAGHREAKAECRDVTFVTRAVCQ